MCDQTGVQTNLISMKIYRSMKRSAENMQDGGPDNGIWERWSWTENSTFMTLDDKNLQRILACGSVLSDLFATDFYIEFGLMTFYKITLYCIDDDFTHKSNISETLFTGLFLQSHLRQIQRNKLQLILNAAVSLNEKWQDSFSAVIASLCNAICKKRKNIRYFSDRWALNAEAQFNNSTRKHFFLLLDSRRFLYYYIWDSNFCTFDVGEFQPLWAHSMMYSVDSSSFTFCFLHLI